MAKKNNNDIFYGFVLNEYQQKFVDAIMSDEHNFILADATAGSGKTLLAVACANLLINRDNRCIKPSPNATSSQVKQSPLIYRKRTERPGSKLILQHFVEV